MENESLRSSGAGFGRSFGHNPAVEAAAPPLEQPAAQPFARSFAPPIDPPPLNPSITPSIAPDLHAPAPLVQPSDQISAANPAQPPTATPDPADPAARAQADYEEGFGPPPDYTQDEYRWVAVRRRPRYDGWNAEKQRRFIEVLADTGIVALAAKAVGMTRESAYRLRRSEHAVGFAEAWDVARTQAGALIEDITFERAIQGIEHNVYDEHGEVVCTKRVYNDRLLMFLLRSLKPELYGHQRPVNAARPPAAPLHSTNIVEGTAQEAAPPHPQSLPPAHDAAVQDDGAVQVDARDHKADTAPAQPIIAPEPAAPAPLAPTPITPTPAPQHPTLDTCLRALEPQPPAPIEQWIGTEDMHDEMDLADIMDGNMPDFLMERRSPKTPDELKAEQRAAQQARGEAIWERLGKGDAHIMNRKDWRDMCLYLDPAQAFEKSKKRYR